MIEILNTRNGKMESFESYNNLFKRIKEIEKHKLEESGLEDWKFTIHPHQRLSSVYWRAVKALEALLTPMEQEAYEKELSLLEICKGDYHNPTQIILTPDIDVKEIKRNWCRDYILENGYMFSETQA